MLPMAENFSKVQEMTWVPSCEKTSRSGGGEGIHRAKELNSGKGEEKKADKQSTR